LFAELEVALAPFNARPHWGKLVTPSYMTKERVRTLYPQAAEFIAMAKEHDPEGVFRNDWIEQLFDFE
jgi:xylitol oxidase